MIEDLLFLLRNKQAQADTSNHRRLISVWCSSPTVASCEIIFYYKDELYSQSTGMIC